jgi:Type IV secretion-system coupling protein DNA-binding domain
MFSLFDGLLHSVVQLVAALALTGLLSLCGGAMLAMGLRLRNLRWTWAILPVPPAALAGFLWVWLAVVGLGACAVACFAGMLWQSHDLLVGGDYGEAAKARLGLYDAAKIAFERWQAAHGARDRVREGWLEVGVDAQGRPVSIPAGRVSGSHTLILGATGAGKTCAEAWIAGRLIERGYGAVAIDPKGDVLLREALRKAAAEAGAPFLQWSPDGPLAYNPYAHGTDTEIADKALAAEVFTEPHYLRQAQRYLGQAVRAIRAAKLDVSAVSLMAHMNPEQLEQTAKRLPGEHRQALHDYLDSLTARQRHELTGVRDRLSILSESDVSRWLDPGAEDGAIDLGDAVAGGAVVYFSLEADRRPLLAQMLAGAIVVDLIALASRLQDEPVPTVVVIDEFSAVGAEQVARLFARGRSAGLSLVLATQELADLAAAGHGALREQVLGNVEALIAYRQTVPQSADLIADVAGTRPAWVTTQRTVPTLLGPRGLGGTRRRMHEHVVHPTRIKQLRPGEAIVIAPGSGRQPTLALMHHPGGAARSSGSPGQTLNVTSPSGASTAESTPAWRSGTVDPR